MARIDQRAFLGRECEESIQLKLVEFGRDLPQAKVRDMPMIHCFSANEKKLCHHNASKMAIRKPLIYKHIFILNPCKPAWILGDVTVVYCTKIKGTPILGKVFVPICPNMSQYVPILIRYSHYDPAAPILHFYAGLLNKPIQWFANIANLSRSFCLKQKMFAAS